MKKVEIEVKTNIPDLKKAHAEAMDKAAELLRVSELPAERRSQVSGHIYKFEVWIDDSPIRQQRVDKLHKMAEDGEVPHIEAFAEFMWDEATKG